MVETIEKLHSKFEEYQALVIKIIESKVLTEQEACLLQCLFLELIIEKASNDQDNYEDHLYVQLLQKIEDVYGDKQKIAVYEALSKNITNYGDVCVLNDYFDEWFETTFTREGYDEYLQVCKSINKQKCDIIKVTGNTLEELHDKMIKKLTPDITTIIYSLKAPLETEEDLKILHAKLAVKCPEALPHGQWIKDDKIEVLILIGKNN